MKKELLYRLYFLPLIITFILGAASCSDDDETKAEPSVLIDNTDIALNRLGLAQDGNKATITIASNVYWKATLTSDDNWLTASTLGGYGSTEITLSATPNAESSSRKASIVVEILNGEKYNVSVTQTGTSDVVYFVDENLDTEPSSMLAIDKYQGWANQGISGLAFRGKGEGAYIDNSEVSSGYTGASGVNNIYFKDEDSYVVLGSFATKGEKAFKLSFGSKSTESTFDKDDFILQVSKDNSWWVDMDYTRTATSGDWAKSEISFYYDDAHTLLYFRLQAKKAETYRVDDLVIEENPTGTGKHIDFSVYIDDGKPDGFVYFFDDFSWITMGPNFIYDVTDSATEIRFDSSSKTPEQSEALLASGWTWATNAFYVYMHKGYVKLGTTAKMGTIISPPFSAIESPAMLNVKVSFKTAMYQSKDGPKDDPKSMIVEMVEGTPGTINNGIDTSVSFLLDSYNSDLKEYSFIIYGATASTQIKFRNYADGKNRMFLDDVKVEKIAKE